MADQTTERFAFPIDSEMWRINHQRCGLIFGPAAAILQIAHPRIAQGVADHSQFHSDSLGRLRRTLASTNRIAFGTVEEAEAVRQRIGGVHRGIRGKISPGMTGCPRYSAFEPDLLLWVLATLIVAALRGYEMVYGALPENRREQFYREMKQFGTYFGLEETRVPVDLSSFETYYSSVIRGDLLASHPLCAELAQSIACPRDSWFARSLGISIRFLVIETLPPDVRERLGFESTPITRHSMHLFKRTIPHLFPLLPQQNRLFPEARERLERESSENPSAKPTGRLSWSN